MALDKDKILSSAAKYIDKEQYDKAIREYQKILEVEPDDERVLLYLAQCFEKSGYTVDAGKTYVKVSQCYRAQGAYQKSLAVLKQAQRYMSDDDEIAIGMAELYNALGLPHEAVAQLERCLVRNEKAQDFRSYVRILQMMVRVDSENVQTRAKYAQALAKGGDKDGAKRQYTLALAQLQSKERYPEYIMLSQEFLQLYPKDTEVIRDLGQIYFRGEKYSDAVAAMTLLAMNERTPEIHELLVSCYVRMHNKPLAAAELKALARQYTEMGGRADMIEDAWTRAQRLAPNDPEIAEVLGDEPPMLSESALNLVAIPQCGFSGEASSIPAGELSYAERMLQSKYNQAFEAYHQGKVDTARMICLQIIDSNEQYVPALRLMEDICDRQGDNVLLAQIERKFAKAVYEQDSNEALRHILKAEQCTPKAWENYNLMLVLGFDPSKYGMSATEATHMSHSNSRIPAQKMRGASGLKPAMPPSVPSPVSRTKTALGGVMVPNSSGSVGRSPVMTASIPWGGGVSAEPESNGQYQFRQIEMGTDNRSDNESSKLGRGLDDLSAVSDDLDDLFSFMVRPGGAKAAPKHESLKVYDEHQEAAEPAVSPIQRERKPSISQPLPPVPVQRERKPSISQPHPPSQPVPPVPAQRERKPSISQPLPPVPVQRERKPSISQPLPPSQSLPPVPVQRERKPSISQPVPPVPVQRERKPSISQPAAASLGATGIRSLSPVLSEPDTANQSIPLNDAAKPVVNSTCLYMNSVPGVALNSASGTMNAVRMPPVAPISPRAGIVPPAVPKITPPAQIPDSEIQRVRESLQEIDFYASLMLLDDAKRLLDDLINEFGDIDIIHDAKEKLAALV